VFLAKQSKPPKQELCELKTEAQKRYQRLWAEVIELLEAALEMD
jgi:hypothetical protein